MLFRKTELSSSVRANKSTRITIEEVKRYADAGADAVLVITPYFYKSAMTQEALYKYYMAVADVLRLCRLFCIACRR